MIYTVKQTAAMLNKSEQTVRRLLRIGKLPGVKIKGVWSVQIATEPNTERKGYEIVDGRIRERSVFEQ